MEIPWMKSGGICVEAQPWKFILQKFPTQQEFSRSQMFILHFNWRDVAKDDATFESSLSR